MVKPKINVNDLKDKILSILSEINRLNIELNKDIPISKRSKLTRLLSFNKSKLKDYLRKLNDLGKGNIIEIKYSLMGETYIAKYTNISKDDAIELLNFKALIYNKEIKILEINDIPTSINKIIL